MRALCLLFTHYAGYTGSGAASNQPVLYDTTSDTLLSTFTPPTTPTPPNGNSPPTSNPSGNGNTGGGNSNTGGSGNTGNPSSPSDPSQTGNPGSDSGSGNKTPAIIGGLFGGLAAAAIIIVLVVVYRRRKEEERRGYGRRAATDDSEKAVMMLGGFDAAPANRGMFTNLFHLHPTQRHPQQPGRERFDILAEEDASYVAVGNDPRPRAYRTGTGGSGSTYGTGGGYFGRWSMIGGAVNASVGSLRSAFGVGPAPSPGGDRSSRDEYMDLGNSASRRSFNASAGARPPSAWRRGSSYTANQADPFGDQHVVEDLGVEDEYRRAMAMQHEGIRRAGTSGADEYSALILGDGRRGIPLEPVPSISTDPSSQSHVDLASEDNHRRGPSDSTHFTSLKTPVEHGLLPRVYSPPLTGQSRQFNYNDNGNLQRATSSSSRIGASLTRAMSAVSSLFGSPPPPYVPVNRGRRTSGGTRLSKSAQIHTPIEYTDLRDPNPPPPMLGLGLVPIEEGHGSRRTGSNAEVDSTGSPYMGRPPLVLKALHGKSLSSLRTANSEALERLGTGHWDVVQRDATSSTRRTEGSNATLGTGSEMTDLGVGDTMRWRDVVGDHDEVVESPRGMDGLYDHGPFWNEHAQRAASGPAGPRPIPPPKETGDPLSPRRTQALYGLVPKPTLYVANPGKKATDSSG